MKSEMVFIQSIVNAIENNLTEDVNIVRLAEKAHISPWHFQRLFKSLVGDTLGQYIRGRRLARGAELLAQSPDSILNIALEVGFQSHEAFTRSFKSYYHMSPKAFRENPSSVTLNTKPLLSPNLFEHFTQDMQREPLIFTRPAQRLVGFNTVIPSPFSLSESYCHMLEEPWYNLLNHRSAILHRVPSTFFGLTISESGRFTEENLTYLSAVPVTHFENVPSQMSTFELPEQLVAVFDVHQVDFDTVNKTMDYIYGYWLPNSNYHRGQGCDYEFFKDVNDFDGLFDAEAFEENSLTSQYVIPLEPR